MEGFHKMLFDKRKMIYTMLSYTGVHLFFISLRNIAMFAYGFLWFNGYFHIADYVFIFFIDILTISIFFAYAQLCYGFSLKDCKNYLFLGIVDKQFLQEIRDDLEKSQKGDVK